MCDPISIGLGVAAASTAANAAASSSAARQQNRYLTAQGEAQDENYRRTVESVREDVGLQTDALMAQQIEAISAQKQQLQNITRDARAASSAYTASLGETGIEGRSVDQVHQQFERGVLEFESAAVRNVSNYTSQLNREARAIYNRGQSIINQGYPAPLPPYQSVNFGLIAVQGALQGLQTGIGYHAATKTP